MSTLFRTRQWFDQCGWGILATFNTDHICYFQNQFLGALKKSEATDMISWFYALHADSFIMGSDVPNLHWDKCLNKGSDCVAM
jgi:hypothetical protein